MVAEKAERHVWRCGINRQFSGLVYADTEQKARELFFKLFTNEGITVHVFEIDDITNDLKTGVIV